MRAVRSEHQGRALCGQRPVGEKESFFGDFLPIGKKLPAGRRTAEAFALQMTTAKSLDSRFRGNDDQEIKAGFQLPLE